MPRTTPEIKVEAVKALGAEVVLAGDRYAEAQQHSERLAADGGLVFIHPFDDPLVIAGQGTIAVEMLRQNPSLTAVFVPVGGGGLIAGIGTYIKALQPGVQVIGVEPVDADAMAQSLAAGHRVRLDDVGLFADGVAVQQVGEHTFPIVQATVDEIIRVDNDEICAAIKDIFDDTRTIAEPAGALALAGLKSHVETRRVSGQRLAAVLSGANMNFDRLRFVAERAELGEGREALLAVTIPERPGAFRAFCAALGARVVTEFNYRLSGREQAQIFVGVATGRTAKDTSWRRACASSVTKPPTCPATRWPSSTCATWSAAGRRPSPRSGCAGSSFRNVRARSCSSSTRWADAGTSACSITAITAPTSGASWSRLKS
jgi:threonine dehydratase